jgi:DNA-binding transcriptional ArsR family regulator
MMMTAFEILAEPHRRQIVELLRSDERAVGELVEALRISQPAVSKHLRVLRESGMVEVRGDAQRRLYRVRPEQLRAIDEWLAPYRVMWARSLDDLEEHLEVMSDD